MADLDELKVAKNYYVDVPFANQGDEEAFVQYLQPADWKNSDVCI